jgi:hypothetical protein
MDNQTFVFLNTIPELGDFQSRKAAADVRIIPGHAVTPKFSSYGGK